MFNLDLLGIVVSPAGLMLAGQLATLLFVVAGFAFMIGWRNFAKRLMVVAIVVIVIPFLVAANFKEINSFFDSAPRWVLVPTLAVGVAIVVCWILWGLIALCFGPAIASNVTANVLTWLFKGIIIAVLAPYRGLSGLARRFVPHDSVD